MLNEVLKVCTGTCREFVVDTVKIKLKAQAIFDGSKLMPIHTSCRSRDVAFTLMLFGCTRAI